jgi:hypothetical protein
MIRSLPVLAILVSLPAWAVGEHIAVTGPAQDQLKESLCISMECGKGGHDFTVTSKLVGDQMELRLLGPDGAARFTQLVPVNGSRQMASTDAMAATSQLVHAIENPTAAKATVEKAEKPAKSVKAKFAKKLKLHAPIRVAARMRDRG